MNNNRKRVIAVLAAVAVLGACATSPDKIQSSSVSKLQYRNHDCDQIADELERVNRRAGELYANLEDEADSDTAEMAVGLILFFPVLFFLEGGDGPQAQEYARIKGEKEALDSVAIEKKCAGGVVDANSVEVRLTKLREMRDDKIISEEEYVQRRSEILQEI